MVKKRVESICKECGGIIKNYPSQIRVFCSIECYNKYKKKNVMPFLVLNRVGWGNRKIEFECAFCGGKSFREISKLNLAKNNFCSFECADRWQKRNKIKRFCNICGEEFYISKSTADRGYGLFCSNKCLNKSIEGEGNRFWKGGKSFEPYSIEFNNSLKKKIRDRGGNKCQVCGLSNEESKNLWGKSLIVHHIDEDKKNSNEENLIPLCLSCHLKYHQRGIKIEPSN